MRRGWRSFAASSTGRSSSRRRWPRLLPEREVVPLGRHLLKDIDEPQPVYSLSNVSPG